jgi:atypical dual specificity phosphatase
MLKIYTGNIAYVFDENNDVVSGSSEIPQEYINNRVKRDGEHHHITLIQKNELESKVMIDLLETIKTCKYYSKMFNIGIGRATKGNEEVYYQIIYWPIGNEIRRELNLPPKDFHVTLGFKNKDIHGINKGYSTLIPRYINLTLLDSSETFFMAFDYKDHKSDKVKYEFLELLDVFNFPSLDERQKCILLDTRIKIYSKLKDYDNCLSNSMILKKHNPYDTINLTRIAQIHQFHKRYYLAIYMYNQLLNSNYIYTTCVIYYSQSKAKTSLDICYEKLGSTCITRDKPVVQIYDSNEEMVSVEMSRNFSWVIPCKLGGISIPKHQDQIKAFEFMNIGLVVSVLEEEQLDASMFEGTTVKNIHYNVVNYHPPVMSDLLEIISKMEDTISTGKGVIVHCGGGKGRAGTILACFMLKHGLDGTINKDGYPKMSGSEAIDKLRELRPGSIETKRQEEFIKEYNNLLWKGN